MDEDHRLHPRDLRPSGARPIAGPGPRPGPATARAAAPRCDTPSPDAVLCERCHSEMFRMHAVWRCPSCGYKTDCCGW